MPIDRKKTSKGGLLEARPSEDLFQKASSAAVVTLSLMPVSFSNSGSSGSMALSQGCLTKNRSSDVPLNCCQSILALSGGSADQAGPTATMQTATNASKRTRILAMLS